MVNILRILAVVVATAVLSSGCTEATENPEPAAAIEQGETQESFARRALDTGGVERVTVQARGVGKNEQVAIDRAIRLAYEQVNGKAFAAATVSLDSEFSARLGKASLEGGASGFADAVVSATNGAVSEFRLLSSDLENGEFTVLIEAAVEKYERPASALLPRVALSPLRTAGSSFSVGGRSLSAEAVSSTVSDRISKALAGSQRVTVLDRAFDTEVQAELARIDAGNWRNEDRVRLGQQLAADYLLVGRIDRLEYLQHTRSMRTTDRKISTWSGGASLTYKLVNVATGQVVVADSVKVDLPATKPTTMGSAVDVDDILDRLVSGISDSPRKEIIQALFPITVVDLDGEMVALSQGGDAIEENKEYAVVLRGREITDPQTGQVVGRLERDCCTVKVTRVTQELSYGVIVSKKIDDIDAAFKPGALELRGEVRSATPQPAATVASATEARPASTPRQTAKTTSSAEAEPDKDEEDPNW